MSSAATTSIPMSVLLAAVDQNLEVMIDTATGYTYRGHIDSVDDAMNVSLTNVTVSKVGDAFFQQLPATFIRGQAVVFVALPTSLQEVYTERAKALKRDLVAKLKEKRLGGGGGGGGGGGPAAQKNDNDKKKAKGAKKEAR
jgi:small nuclear ribonucleoprotein (snRNP)-like protein